MANIKDAILRKKIGETIFDLMVKTTSAMVYVDDTTTLKTKLEAMLADIADSKGKLATLLGDDPAQSITAQIETAVNNAVAALEDADDPDSLAGKIAAINVAINTINDGETGILAQAKKYTDDKIGLSGTAYTDVKSYVDAVKAEINAATAGAFHFKGVVDYVKDLPTENVQAGDVYQVRYAGETGENPLNAEYAYDGTQFTELGSVIDLSAYYTSEQTVAAINTAKQEAIAAAAADATTKADNAKNEAIAVAVQRARFFVQAEQPEDLTEYDIWAQVVNEE